MQTFRNSLGDISVPKYEYWEKRVDKNYLVSNTYIEIIWFVFFMNSIIMLVVLLNFLIAIVSESYERVNAMSMQFNYILKAELNIETLLLKQGFLKLLPCLDKMKSFEIFMKMQEAKDYHNDEDEVK